MAVHSKTLIQTCALASAAFMATCSNGDGAPGDRTAQVTSRVSVSSARLHLTQQTNTCSSKQVQNIFRITNEGDTDIALADVSFKMWVDEATAASIVASLNGDGCVSAHGPGSDDCAGQSKVQGITAMVAPMATACGPGPNAQANWEVTILNSDPGVIAPGQSWHKIHTKLKLPGNSSFYPGTGSWYSACQPTDGEYHETSRVAVYHNGELVTASPGVPPACVAPQAEQPVPGVAAPAIMNGEFPLVGPVEPEATITLAISLPLQNVADLDNFIARTQDPADPLFHQYLNQTDFRDTFGASQADHDAVVAWATSNDLTVTHSSTSRTLINVSGTAAAISKALLVTMNLYQRADGSIFYAPANDPSLNLSVPLLSIAGLDSISVPQGQSGTGNPFTNCPDGTGTNGNAYVGSDFNKVYMSAVDSTQNHGGGVTVALLAFDGFYPSAGAFVSDPQTYFNQKGLPTAEPTQVVVNAKTPTAINVASNGLALSSCTSASTCNIIVDDASTYDQGGILTINVGGVDTLVKCTSRTGNTFRGCRGGSGTLATGNPVSSPILVTTSEVAVAAEMIASVAPRVSMTVYEWEHNGVTNVSSAAFPALLNAAADDVLVSVVHNAYLWQATGATPDPSIADTLRKIAATGKTFVQAAGDIGAYASPATCTTVAGHCRVHPAKTCNANADCNDTCNTGAGTCVISGVGCATNADCANTCNAVAHTCKISGAICATDADCSEACITGVPSPIIDSPYMLVVGGTQLNSTVNGDGTQTYNSETVWNNSTIATINSSGPIHGATGGGQASCYTNAVGTAYPSLAQPLWQQPLGGTTRMIPDVTMVATQIGAFADGAWSTCVSGTSASSALWAGVIALINQKAATFGHLGFANPRLYELAAQPAATNFRDVTTGGNAFSGSGVAGYTAGVGYDRASGLGSPTSAIVGLSLPVQGCQSGANLTVIINPSTHPTKPNRVIAYIPNGSWTENVTGVYMVEVDAPGGILASPVLIPTSDAINTCAGESSTGRIVCTGNNNNIYFIEGTTLKGTMQSPAALGTAYFSGGWCKTCNVAVDPTFHEAWISIGLAGGGVGIQRLSLPAVWALLPASGPPVTVPGAAPQLLAPIQTESTPYETLAEAISIDPGVVGSKRLVIAPNEENNFQLIDASAGAEATGKVYDNNLTLSGWMDHGAQDCSTGIILSALEFWEGLYIADLHQVTFTEPAGPGLHGSWSTTAQSVIQFPELQLPDYGYGVAGGVAVTSNPVLHLGVLVNEFGGNGFAVFQLPSTSGASAGVPGVVDYVVAGVPNPPGSNWTMGRDPHNLGVFTSPVTGRQYAILQNDKDLMGTRDWLAIVDMESLLTVAPREAGTNRVLPGYDLVAAGIVKFVRNVP